MRKIKKICGIYCIENKINNKKYIGQSVDIKSRWREHKYNYKNNSKDYHLKIYNAIRKYGIENFDFYIIEECEESELNNREMYWIQYYDSFKNGYNCNIGGQSSHFVGKAVLCYDLDGNFVREFESPKAFAINMGVSRAVVYQVLYGKRKSTCGYQLKYKYSDKVIDKYVSRKGGAIKIVQLDKNTNELINVFNSSYDAKRVTNIDSSSITKCCKRYHGDIKSGYLTANGFKWMYYDDYINMYEGDNI